MASWLVAFILTQAVELPVFGVALRKWPVWRRLAVGFGASAATHPWVWFVLPPYLQPVLGYAGYVALVECGVIVAEALYFAAMGVALRRACIVAVIANSLSAAAGFGMHISSSGPNRVDGRNAGDGHVDSCGFRKSRRASAKSRSDRSFGAGRPGVCYVLLRDATTIHAAGPADVRVV